MTGSVQDKNGKWYCVLNCKEEGGKRKQKWIPTGLPIKGNKRKAQQILHELLQQYEGKETIKNYSKMDFADYCDFWLSLKKNQIEVTTYVGYQSRIAHIRDYFSKRNFSLGKITPRDVQDFYQYLSENGNLSKYRKKSGLSERTIKDTAVLLREIFKNAYLRGDIVSDPAKDIPILRKKKEIIKQDIFIDEDDMKILFSEIKGHILEGVIKLTLHCGMRRSEVLGLKWDAVDFEKGTMQVKRTVVKASGIIEKETTKTDASFRTYPLNDFIRNVLRTEKEKQKRNRKLLGNDYVENDFVFTWDDGRMISPDYVSHAFKKIVTRSEALPSELTFHDLRDSCTSILFQRGMTLKEVQRWIGHADANTTMNIYAKVKDSAMQKVGMELSEVFQNAG